ncbi:hypothetical protein ACFQ6B_38705 [Streptomyces wedmorensis]|uniref:Uncharacterized protein n=1 Tax=Streptomyces wedmorensis TaxID=43759 RepID=A0ABW6J9K3_STRWE
MKKQVSARLAVAFAVTALAAGGAAVTSGESTIQAEAINSHP